MTIVLHSHQKAAFNAVGEVIADLSPSIAGLRVGASFMGKGFSASCDNPISQYRGGVFGYGETLGGAVYDMLDKRAAIITEDQGELETPREVAAAIKALVPATDEGKALIVKIDALKVKL